MGNKLSTEDHIFRLKLKTKELEKLSQRSELEEKKLIGDVKKAIQAGKIELARLYAEKCIRKKNEKVNYLNLSNKLDVLVSRLEGAHRCASLVKDVGVMIPLIQKINAETNAIKIGNDVTKLENIFDEISISSELINDTVQTSSAISAPTEEVDELISKIADEHALKLDGQIGSVHPINKHLEEISNMSERIKNLK
ncbi:putative vacuolar protein sorting-associated protein 46 [Plasmodium gaboni]|uniref:Putative vacuolar protein sorting-associated protein 46 n=1 Tax=Plasmodium gaboni TaxID=647221 RepID=A0A151LLS7_9APIC|nr:putative vacuolar protein sorting-associated protein 46 [Plasmodium gaboni]XP_028538066.1 vacuolar protein sorting-associated protein 46, putative [Plasmodium sp. gorilla clade G2]SOV22428.1 vacuolar protein sorting-associated protein 46, putative [Plasmodium sp. DRC-Itaito]KYO00049.1 putative vacuolar protein sorting-associated protein 46 [Plasmodium gaboni]SOV13905.1 vacuolar protein sorting-associated protein 46, putative [Plasmodium gaboni]SOV13988.1 vacuolar protein sorting-associated 